MDFEVLCTACDTSYEASVSELVRNISVLNCPQCNERADNAALESLREATESFFEVLAELAPVMTVAMEIDSSELPAPFGVGIDSVDSVDLDDDLDDDDEDDDDEDGGDLVDDDYED